LDYDQKFESLEFLEKNRFNFYSVSEKPFFIFIHFYRAMH